MTSRARDQERKVVDILGSAIDALSWDAAIERILGWAAHRESRYVCICNVHSVVTASSDPAFQAIINDADMATADGAPVAWLMRRMGTVGQARINGPDLMWRVCSAAQGRDVSMFFYGGNADTLHLLQQRLANEFPALRIAGSHSPPFRELSVSEIEEIVRRINDSGAGVVWVSLGCPKQERWMARNSHALNAVLVGVGAAFDYHAGTLKRAPLWMQKRGLEWLHRLFSEPRRLWKRYLVTNSLFVIKAATQLVRRT